MKNVIDIAKGIANDFHLSTPTLPTIRCYSVGEKMSSEGFRIRPMAREWQVDAEGPLGAAYGATYAAAILKSGHHTLLSNNTLRPRFPLRALWLASIPNEQLICRRLIEMGHNAIIIDDALATPALLSALSQNGLKAIISVDLQDDTPCPFECAVKALPAGDMVLWKSRLLDPCYHRHPSARNVTLADVVRAEMRYIESLLTPSQQLIFYLPTHDHAHAIQQMHWLPTLIDDAGPCTTIAFPAVAGDPTHDHLPLHPLWSFFRADSLPSATPLLPIINAGAVSLGGGLWPYLNIDHLQNLYSRLNPYHFKGAIHLASALPQQGSFLDALLWTAGTSLWLSIDPLRAFETWVSANRPELFQFPLFRQASYIILIFSSLRLNPSRAATESLWAQLDALAEGVNATTFPEEPNRISLKEYFLCCIRDVRKMLLHYMQPCTKAVRQEDLQESFWADVQAEAWQGLRPSGQVRLFGQANPGKEGSIVSCMYRESLY